MISSSIVTAPSVHALDQDVARASTTRKMYLLDTYMFSDDGAAVANFTSAPSTERGNEFKLVLDKTIFHPQVTVEVSPEPTIVIMRNLFRNVGIRHRRQSICVRVVGRHRTSG
jgi:hypothetical protein